MTSVIKSGSNGNTAEVDSNGRLTTFAVTQTEDVASANKSVSNTTPANVQIYQSDEVDSLSIVNGIVAPQLVGSANVDYIGLNLLVPEGRWVNATTDDATVLVTIMFYRVPVEFV